jgi:hypothetical protein
MLHIGEFQPDLSNLYCLFTYTAIELAIGTFISPRSHMECHRLPLSSNSSY